MMTDAHLATDTSYAPTQGITGHLSTCMCAACCQEREDRDGADANDGLSADVVASAATEATLSEMADFLQSGYWSPRGPRQHNLGTTGNDPNNGVLHYNVSGFGSLFYGGGPDQDGVTDERAALIRDVFDVYEAVLGIRFVETTSTDEDLVDFFFSDNQSGAYAGSVTYRDGSIYYSYINVAANWSGGTSTYDDYTLQTLFHEVGHALGLGHQGDYNGSGGYASDAQFELDSWQATMMSYFDQRENTAIDASYELLQTPMAVDWLALDSIYGQYGYGVSNAFAGDTTYGFNTTISAQDSRIWNRYSDYADRTASTIIDGGGIDTVDFSGYGADQKIDLTVQRADQTYQDSSDIGGRIGNLTLAVGTVIENAVGGSGDDRLIGNEGDNILRGGAGDDTFTGLQGDDVFHGDAGFDTVIYTLDFASYAFRLVPGVIRVIGEGVDLVHDTVERFQFVDAIYSFAEIAALSANAAPVAADDNAAVNEGAALVLDVLANDSDADGDALTITHVDGRAIVQGGTVTLGSGAVVTLNVDGTLGYDQKGAFDALGQGETGQERFGYTVADGAGGSDTADVTVSVSGQGAASAVIGQSGVVTVSQSGADQWHRVQFDARIADAVVVMGPLGLNDDDPATVRVRNVTDTGFEFQIDEWNYLDGVHGAETISWLAMSEGSHRLSDGRTILAGQRETGTSFGGVQFSETLDDAVVLAQASSVNDADAIATRLRNVTGTGFEVQIEEEEARGAHVPETVSWIAIETGSGAGLDVVRTGKVVDHTASSFAFDSAFASAPVLLGGLQSTHGGDSATLRISALDGNGVSLFVQEETSRDSETAHTHETAGFVAMDMGLIRVGANAAPLAADDSAMVDEGAALVLDVLANDSDADGDALTITHVDGTAIAQGGSVTLGSGAVVTLNADGTLGYDQNGAFDALAQGETGQERFGYTVADGAGGSDTADVTVTVSGQGAGSDHIGQSGVVTVSQSGADQWHSVQFDARITDAVVVMGPLSFNDDAAAVTRVRNVTDTGFEFQIDEWNYLDGVHGAETISWLAMSEGRHTLANGQVIVADQQLVSNGFGFSDITFGGTLDDAVVLTEVVTVNDSDAVTTRVRNVSGTGFEVQLEEEEALGNHLPEQVAWIAIETGTGAGLDVVRTPDQLDEVADSFVFNTAFDSAPVLLADLQSTDGGDPVALRLSALSDSGLSLFAQEEQSANPEVGHTNETAGYVAMTDGLIYLDSFLN